MIGILTEKPSAGRNFAKALGGPSGTYQGQQYVIVSAFGHLYEYVDPDKQVPAAYASQYKAWDLKYLPWDEKLFDWKREKKPDVSSTLQQIKSVLSGCDEVVIATDVDPTGEGELLAWEILDELNIRNKKFTRMYFDDESVKEVQKAFLSRKVLPAMRQDMDYVKAEYRSQWDMLSMQFTRIATNCVNNKAVLRQGRLKSVMVKIVGDGLAAVKAYKKVPFYMNKFKDENGVIYTNPEEPRFPDKKQVPQTYHMSGVVCDEKSMKQTPPPKLIDLASLSAKLSVHGYKAKVVLDTYQKMYEAQVVSYPRTEDKVITPEQFNDLLPKVNAIAAVVGVDVSLLTHRQPRSTHVKTGGAHGANRPGPNVPNTLNELTKYGACAPMIYEILAKNYLAILAENYEYEFQKGHVKDYPKFVGSASVPKKMGWKLVFNDDADPDDTENAKGLGAQASPFVAEGANPKPPTPTMTWLMKQLEKNDVGTGATRTGTYADVTNAATKYPLLVDQKGKITMSPYGNMSYILLKDTYIGDVKMTEALMQEMRDIASGKLNPADCLHKVQDYVRHDMDVMLRNKAELTKELGTMGAAGDIAPKEKYEGIWNGSPVKFTREWGGHRFTDEECEELCAGNTIVLTDIKGRSGSVYSVEGKLAEQEYKGRKFIGFERGKIIDTGNGGSGMQKEKYEGTWKKKPVRFSREWGGHRFTDEECKDLCAGKTIEFTAKSKKGDDYQVKGKLANLTYNGVKYVGFQKEDTSGVPMGWCEHTFTDDERTLLEAGKEVYIEGFVSNKGNVFNCYVKYGKNDKGRMGIIPNFDRK